MGLQVLPSLSALFLSNYRVYAFYITQSYTHIGQFADLNNVFTWKSINTNNKYTYTSIEAPYPLLLTLYTNADRKRKERRGNGEGRRDVELLAAINGQIVCK